MLEVFTSHDSFYDPADPVGNRKDAAMVTVYLTRNGKDTQVEIYKIIFCEIIRSDSYEEI